MLDITSMPERPTYGLPLQARILRALIKAKEAQHKAWLIGVSSINGDTAYMVYSSSGEGGPYYVRAHDNASMGGYVYAMERDEPIVWLRCSCPASEHGNPCWHCAKVHWRLVRESQRGLRGEGGE